MRKHSLIHLDDICKKFEIILLDSSAIMGFLDLNGMGFKKNSKLIDKINRKKAEETSYTFFNKYIKKTKKFFCGNSG